MKIYLVKPDLIYYEQYNEMMKEWNENDTHIAPWFLDKPISSIEEFEKFIKMLDDCEHGRLDKKYATTSSYFIINEENKLVGATSLRHYLTIEGFNGWGHIGYGIRPSERRKKYATTACKLMLEEAKKRGIYKVLIGVRDSNTGSIKVIENCGGKLENIVNIIGEEEKVRRYWIDNK